MTKNTLEQRIGEILRLASVSNKISELGGRMQKLKTLLFSHDISEVGLLSVELCFSLISIFIGVFLTAQIFTLSGESFVTLGLFSIVNVMFVFLFQLIGGLL